MVSGPPTQDTGINNSGLGRIKRILTGGAPFLGSPRVFQMGTEFHYRCLNRKKGKWKPIDEKEKGSMEGMVKSIHTCKLFLKLLPGSTVEKKIIKPQAFGIHRMHGTPDLRKRRVGLDLKTTSATTEEEFIAKVFELDYDRQDVVYEELADLDEFYFIGVCKENMGTEKKPFYPHWVVDMNNYEKQKQIAEEQAKFLLTFFHDFGVPLKSGLKNESLEPYIGGGQDSES